MKREDDRSADADVSVGVGRPAARITAFDPSAEAEAFPSEPRVNGIARERRIDPRIERRMDAARGMARLIAGTEIDALDACVHAEAQPVGDDPVRVDPRAQTDVGQLE